MTLVVRKPKTLAGTFDQLFNEFFRDDYPVNGNSRRVLTRPATNVVEMAEAFRIELALPGLDKSDFQVNIEEDVLKITAHKSRELQEGENLKRHEFGDVKYERSFQLPETIDTENIEATYENGILHITLPKLEEAKEKPVRKIEVA